MGVKGRRHVPANPRDSRWIAFVIKGECSIHFVLENEHLHVFLELNSLLTHEVIAKLRGQPAERSSRFFHSTRRHDTGHYVTPDLRVHFI